MYVILGDKKSGEARGEEGLLWRPGFAAKRHGQGDQKGVPENESHVPPGQEPHGGGRGDVSKVGNLLHKAFVHVGHSVLWSVCSYLFIYFYSFINLFFYCSICCMHA